VIRDAIDARYPDDQAHGFEQGDLLGLLPGLVTLGLVFYCPIKMDY
jgi:hypothetical protein